MSLLCVSDVGLGGLCVYVCLRVSVCACPISSEVVCVAVLARSYYGVLVKFVRECLLK